MKLFLFLFFSVASSVAFSQDYYETKTYTKKDSADYRKFALSLPVALTNFNTYGYVNGMRIDSISAGYASFSKDANDQVYMDWGQGGKRDKNKRVTDSLGHPITFPYTSLVYILNFFHYNKWDMTPARPVSYVAGNIDSEIILKKNDD